MAKIICIKCGLTGGSKCPHCRSIFARHGGKVDMIDTILSHRLKITDEGILIKRGNSYPPGPFDPKAEPIGKETDFELLEMIARLIGDLTNEELKIASCVHEWEFAPFAKSDIECGHCSPEVTRSGNVLDYMSNAHYRLTDATTYSPTGNYCSVCDKHDIWCRHIPEPESNRMSHPRDDNDKRAAQIIHDALTAVDAGVEWTYAKEAK